MVWRGGDIEYGVEGDIGYGVEGDIWEATCIQSWGGLFGAPSYIAFVNIGWGGGGGGGGGRGKTHLQ